MKRMLLLLAILTAVGWTAPAALAQSSNLSQRDRYFIFRNYYLGQERQRQQLQQQRELQEQIDRARRTESIVRSSQMDDPLGNYVRGVGRGGYQPFYQREREFAGRPAATFGASGGNGSPYFSPTQGLSSQRRSPRYGTVR